MMFKFYHYSTLIALIFLSFNFNYATTSERGTVQVLDYAKNFDIVDLSTHRIATVYTHKGASTQPYKYALVPKGAPLPELPKEVPVIRTPVERVVVLETTYIGYLEALDQLETIVGAGTVNYISNSTVRLQIEQGLIQKVRTRPVPDVERLLLLKPDLIFVSAPSEPTQTLPTQLARAGLPVVITSGYREQHPLARAEWIKFVAAFLDVSEIAEEAFSATASRYKNLSQSVDAIEKKPTVFCGAPYSGVWHMAGGDSYVAQIIHDAGGNYLWSDTTHANALPLDVERVFLKASAADIWLNPGIYRNRKSLLSADPRFDKFHAVKTGQMYNNTRLQTKSIGNPIWETGIANPDDVLADMIKIFHPDHMSDRAFVYYEQLK